MSNEASGAEAGQRGPGSGPGGMPPGAPPGVRGEPPGSAEPLVPRIDWHTLLGGVAMIAIGAFFLVGALGMTLGTARRMGPGYFPMLLGAIAILLGLLIMVQGLRRPGRGERPAWWVAVTVLASVSAFALTIERAGLVPAIFLAVLIASLADRESRLVGALIAAAVTSVGAWAIFILGLRMTMPTFRMPF